MTSLMNIFVDLLQKVLSNFHILTPFWIPHDLTAADPLKDSNDSLTLKIPIREQDIWEN